MFLIQHLIYCLQLWLACAQSKDSFGLAGSYSHQSKKNCVYIFHYRLLWFLKGEIPSRVRDSLSAWTNFLGGAAAIGALSSKEPLLDALSQSIFKMWCWSLFSEPHQRTHIVSFLRTKLFNDKKEQETERPGSPIRKATVTLTLMEDGLLHTLATVWNSSPRTVIMF